MSINAALNVQESHVRTNYSTSATPDGLNQSFHDYTSELNSSQDFFYIWQKKSGSSWSEWLFGKWFKNGGLSYLNCQGCPWDQRPIFSSPLLQTLPIFWGGHFNPPPLSSAPFYHLPRFLFHPFSTYQSCLFLSPCSIEILNCNLGRDGTTDRRIWDRCWNEGRYVLMGGPWVTADMLKRAFCTFQLSRRSQRHSLCLPPPPIESDSPARAASFLPLFPPLYCSVGICRDWLTVPSHVTRAAQVPHHWKLDTTHPLHLHPAIQAQVYGNTVCKFFFCMQMRDHAAQTQT